MKKNIYTLFLVFYCLPFIGISQEMTIEQTVQYINKKLSENISYGNPKWYSGVHYEYKIEILNDGYFLIYGFSFKSKFNSQSKECYLIKHKISISSLKYSCIYENQKIGVITFEGIKDDYCCQNCYTPDIGCTNCGPFRSEIYFSNTEIVGDPLCNAFSYLINLIQSDPKYERRPNENDPFASSKLKNNSNTISTGSNSNTIKLEKTSGVYTIPVVLNGVLKLNFIYDSGASDVSISPDVALTLIKTGTLAQTDFIGTQKYQFADGSTALSKVFIIRELQIGNQSIRNVKASISNSVGAPMLLGQSVMNKFGKLIIDNNLGTLTIIKN